MCRVKVLCIAFKHNTGMHSDPGIANYCKIADNTVLMIKFSSEPVLIHLRHAPCKSNMQVCLLQTWRSLVL